MFNMLFGFLGGSLLPLQTCINSNLRRRVGTPFLASCISFGVGIIFLTLITLAALRDLTIPFAAIVKEPWWIWTGGLMGVIFLTGNILLMPRIGGVQTVVFPVFGLIVISLLIDNFQWFHSTYKPLTATRISGAALALLGVILISLAKSRGGGEKKKRDASVWLWRLLGVFTGMMSGMQIAVNGYLGRVIGAPLKASLISFVVGFLALVIIVLVTRQRPIKKAELNEKFPWWIWIGGAMGAVYLFSMVTISPRLGTGMAAVLSQTGQMTSGILVDQFGWFRSQKKPVSWLSIAGIACMVAGACMIQLLGQA